MVGGAGRSEDPKGPSPVLRAERRLTESQAVLWSVVVVASVFDVLTTMVGLANRLDEGNAIARAFIETYGTPGIGLLKFSALVVLVIVWSLLPVRKATVALAGFGALSVLTVALNAMTLASM